MPDEIEIEYELTIPVVITADILGENRDARFDEPGECQYSGDIKITWNQDDITNKIDKDEIESLRKAIDDEINYRGATNG
jgi:hypothetical protein